MLENIVITGSSGFIGQALIKKLKINKISYQAYSRKKKKNKKITKFLIKQIQKKKKIT